MCVCILVQTTKCDNETTNSEQRSSSSSSSSTTTTTSSTPVVVMVIAHASFVVCYPVLVSQLVSGCPHSVLPLLKREAQCPMLLCSFVANLITVGGGAGAGVVSSNSISISSMSSICSFVWCSCTGQSAAFRLAMSCVFFSVVVVVSTCCCCCPISSC